MLNVAATAIGIKNSQKRIREARNGGIAIQEYPNYIEKKESLISGVKDKINTILFGDELDIDSMFGKKEDGNLVSDEEIKKMELYAVMQEIKKDPDFEKFKEIFKLVKSEYDKNKNIPMLAKYIELAGLSEEQKEIFGKISFKIRTEIIDELHKATLEPGVNNYTLNILKELDALFALGERDFNI